MLAIALPAFAGPTLVLWIQDPDNQAHIMTSVSCILGSNLKYESSLNGTCQMGVKDVLDGKFYNCYGQPAIYDPGEFQIWPVYLATFSGYSSPNIYLHWFLQDADGTAGKIEWRISVHDTGQYWPRYANVAASTIDAGCLTLPALSSNQMEGEWYLGVVAQNISPAVPEPGSMMAMLSGLVGLMGYGLRRRQR